MTIFADECVNKDVIESLKTKGFKVISVFDAGLESSADDKIFHHITANGYVLLTFDKDFGNILMFNIEKSAGIIIVYIEDMTKEEIIKNTVAFFEKFNSAQIKGKLFIIERARIKVWPR